MELEGFVNASALMHCGVYALVYKDEVVYIGQSRQPLQRLATHINYRKRKYPKPMGYRQVKVGINFDRIWFRPCMLRELDDLEIAMIKKYQPRHNQKHAPPKPSISLEMLVDMMPANVMPPPTGPRFSSWRRL